MGKYGKRNTISKKITDYSILLLGESGIGKTTTMYEMCEKVAGEDGYIIFNMGKEDGVACIDGAVYENIDNWKKFDEVTKDIIKNKATDYPDLKIVVIDTIDQLFDIAEPEIIRRYNTEKMSEKNFKPIKTINAAYGGFGAGLQQTEQLVLDKIWELKKAGVAVWMCGHVKAKEILDPVTDQTYNTLSALLSQRYFNAIKTKVHVVGMAVIDRSIVTEDTGRKNIVTKEEITRNKVTDETRKIIFRDDNYGVDSKSRFKYIVDEIPMDSNAFIKAIQDAIYKASKDGDSISQSTKEEAVIIKKEPKEEVPFDEDIASDDMDTDLDEDALNQPEESDLSQFSDDELRTEIRKANRVAADNVKMEVKNILKDAGVKLNDASRDILESIMKLF